MDGFHPPHLNGSYTVAVDVHNDFISMQQNRMGASIKMAVESSKARTALYRAHNSHPFSGVLIRDAGNQFIRQHFAIACAAKKKKKSFGLDSLHFVLSSGCTKNTIVWMQIHFLKSMYSRLKTVSGEAR